jgi:ribosomal protein L20A (L18A)
MDDQSTHHTFLFYKIFGGKHKLRINKLNVTSISNALEHQVPNQRKYVFKIFEIMI